MAIERAEVKDANYVSANPEQLQRDANQIEK